MIFQENDLSNDKFYIIFSGVVSIVTQKKENVFIEENEEENTKLVEKFTRKKTTHLTTVKISTTEDREKSPKKFSLFTPFLEKVMNENENNEEQVKKKGSFFTVAINLKKMRKKQKQINVEDILKRNSTDIDGEEKFEEKLKNYGFVLNNLTQGESFGEKALLGEACKRTATVVAATDVELLIIKKQNFLEITQKFNLEKEKKKRLLMHALPYLNTIRSINTLENLLYCFKEENLIFGFCVTEEDSIDVGEKIYFLAEGRCKVERKFYETNNSITQVTNCQITEVSNESIIGEEILFEEQSFYKYTVTVKLFVIFSLIIYCR